MRTKIVLKIDVYSFPESDFEIYYLRELIKLPHVRQLQESSLGLSRGGAAGYRLGSAAHFLLVYTCFRDFEALRVDSQHLNSPLP